MIPRHLFLEVLLALRYLRGQKRTVLFNTGARLSLIFMTLMVHIMVLVLSVFEGFQRQVQDSLRNSGAHITIKNKNVKEPIVGHEALINAARAGGGEDVRAAYGSIHVTALLERRSRFEGKFVRAIPADPAELERSGRMTDYPPLVHYNKEYMRDFDGGRFVLVGREMARYNNLRIGQKLKLYMPRGGRISGPDGGVSNEEFVIAGFFRTGYLEFDSNLILMSLATAQQFLALRDRVTEVVVALNSLSNLDVVRTRIEAALPNAGKDNNITTIKDKRGNFLAALKLEKVLMIIIMCLLIIAGSAGIWVSVHLLIKAKSRAIGMLRAMGMPVRSIMFVFIIHSMIIGALATVIGGSIGMFTAKRLESVILITEDLYNSACRSLSDSCRPIELIPKDIYYFDHLPVSIDLNIIFAIAFGTVVLAGLAGFFPALRTARMEPVETLRND